MSKVSQVAVGLLLITVGYVLGASQSFQSSLLHAQQASGTPTEETEDKIKRGVKQLVDAQSALEQENFMRPATKGLNAFAVSCGGVNAGMVLTRKRSPVCMQEWPSRMLQHNWDVTTRAELPTKIRSCVCIRYPV